MTTQCPCSADTSWALKVGHASVASSFVGAIVSSAVMYSELNFNSFISVGDLVLAGDKMLYFNA